MLKSTDLKKLQNEGPKVDACISHRMENKIDIRDLFGGEFLGDGKGN